MERREEERLREDEGDIYGIPRSEWVKLETPARYLGNEFGSLHKPWDEATVRFTLTYPEIYEVGASNLGHVILYGLLNKEPGLLLVELLMLRQVIPQVTALHQIDYQIQVLTILICKVHVHQESINKNIY